MDLKVNKTFNKIKIQCYHSDFFDFQEIFKIRTNFLRFFKIYNFSKKDPKWKNHRLKVPRYPSSSK